jgi:hypothetical protein
MKQSDGDSRVFWRPIAAVLLVALIPLGAVLAGCGSPTESYKSQWVDTVTAFEAQIAKDDQKSAELVKKNDAAGLLALVEKRNKFVDDTYDKLVVLRPPPALRDLHATTLFYLISIKNQLKANSDFYDAARAGKPTTDLQAIAEDAIKQTQAVRVMLGLAMEKAGVKIKETAQKEVPTSTAPQTIPK